jgi:hypothetical protein
MGLGFLARSYAEGAKILHDNQSKANTNLPLYF